MPLFRRLGLCESFTDLLHHKSISSNSIIFLVAGDKPIHSLFSLAPSLFISSVFNSFLRVHPLNCTKFLNYAMTLCHNILLLIVLLSVYTIWIMLQFVFCLRIFLTICLFCCSRIPYQVWLFKRYILEILMIMRFCLVFFFNLLPSKANYN